MHAFHANLSRPASPTRPSDADCAPAASFVLHFASLFHAGREFAFPCDEHGSVNLDTLPARLRNNYLYARAMLGREFAWPSVRCLNTGYAAPSATVVA